MKITLLKNVGKHGVITGYKCLVPDRVTFDTGESGMLYIGTKGFICEGIVEMPEYELKQGPNKITFVDQAGDVYNCGTISRSTRFINVTNPLDSLIVDIAMSYNEQSERIRQLEDAIKTIKTQYGISII